MSATRLPADDDGQAAHRDGDANERDDTVASSYAMPVHHHAPDSSADAEMNGADEEHEHTNAIEARADGGASPHDELPGARDATLSDAYEVQRHRNEVQRHRNEARVFAHVVATRAD